MKIKFLSLLAVVLVLIAGAGCLSPPAVEDKNIGGGRISDIGDTSIADGSSSQSGQQVTVTDHLNRSVTINKKPERIISSYYISTSALIALGLKDNLVGIEDNAQKRPIYSFVAPDLLDLPSVGTVKELNLEGCIALDPDLVVLPIKLKDQINTLGDMGITVIGVNPENQELLNEMIIMIARLTGSDRDSELIDYCNMKENELQGIHKESKDKPKVYLAGNSDMLKTATKGMYQNELIESAGGVNVAGNIDDTYWATISYEQLIEYNPDFIIMASNAEYTIEDILEDRNLAGITAIKNGNVFKMPGQFEAWDSPVPSGVLGKIWLANILYGDSYSYTTFVDNVCEFYERFYGFKVDTKELMADGQP
ncbi:MAG: ABC transporter substrate-binding protein [Clostridiales bacterium]|nr:ABC transporter substrate-binding protein [Clostridiales bacterium]